jgi:hypothetical protein
MILGLSLTATVFFSGCAAVGQLVPDVQVSKKELQATIQQKTPITVPVSQLAEIQLSSPQLRLNPDSQTIGLHLNLVADAKLLKQKWAGSFAFEFNVRYAADKQEFQLVNPRLKQLAIPGLPVQLVAVVEKTLDQTAQKMLNGFPVYQLTAQDAEKLKLYGLNPGQLIIQSDHIILPLHAKN